MNLGVDIDNVLANFNAALLQNYLQHDKTLRNTGIVHPDAYIRGMFDWSEAEETQYYQANIERIARSLRPIRDCAKYLKALRQQGHVIYLISGRNNGEYVNPYQMTVQWLKRYRIEYDQLILTDAYRHQEKVAACLENKIDLMIDDSSNVCAQCAKQQIQTLLFNTPYNQHATQFTRVENWQAIFDYIQQIQPPKLNVILDTDTNNECDDQFALAYLLKSQDRFHIEAITVAPYSHPARETISSGQTKSYQTILKICGWLNFDPTGKVFRGAEDYLSNGCTADNDAVQQIIKIALKNDYTYVMAIGALTNVALAMQKAPQIINKIEVIWLGGHSLLQNNNQEYNFQQDVSAVRTVFNSKVKLTVIPCKNVASNLRTSIYELRHYLPKKKPLNRYLMQRFYNDGYHGIQERRVIWDIAVVAYLINPHWFTTQSISCPQINDDASYQLTTNQHPITMVNHVDVDLVYRDLFRKLGN